MMVRIGAFALAVVAAFGVGKTFSATFTDRVPGVAVAADEAARLWGSCLVNVTGKQPPQCSDICGWDNNVQKIGTSETGVTGKGVACADNINCTRQSLGTKACGGY